LTKLEKFLKSEFFESTKLYKKNVLQRIEFYLKPAEPASLYDPMRYALQDGGKLLRPILAQVACEAVGGSIDDVVDAAAALELVHVFSLVHDDIMDADELRRGRETVYKKWDINTAILSGDAILVKAYEAINQVAAVHLPRALKQFSRGILEVCEGQALDMEFEDRDDVTLDDYFAMIDRKTGRLFGLACELGAILGNGSEDQIVALRTYGEKLGRAFQIQDDLLDVLADQETLGKDVGSDIQEDKKTYLMLYTREHANAAQRDELDAVIRKTDVTPSEIKGIIKIMNDVGAIDAAKNLVKDALLEARKSVDVLPVSTARDLLVSLLDMLEHRTY
jgi:geranylgeranyl pyrophosphate synthase